ncbi:MAG: lipid-binding SYLF domain-containing protein [Pseudomonadota bacterium]
MVTRLISRSFVMAATLAALAFAAAAPASAGKAEKADRLIQKSADTIDYFIRDDSFTALWDLADQAKAVVVVPQSIRAGFIFGGSAGDAVLTARNEDGTWSEPSFMTVGSFSFGLQAGGEASEIILLVMTQRGMEQLLSSSVKLGADLTVAAGPVGAGAKAQTTDILAFSRSRGLYGGVSLEGAVLKVRHNFNEAYYGAPVSPADIIYRQRVSNPRSAALQNAAYALSQRGNLTQPPAPRPAPQAAAPYEPAAGAPKGVQAPTPASAQADEASRYDDDAAWGAPVKSGPDRR